MQPPLVRVQSLYKLQMGQTFFDIYDYIPKGALGTIGRYGIIIIIAKSPIGTCQSKQVSFNDYNYT